MAEPWRHGGAASAASSRPGRGARPGAPSSHGVQLRAPPANGTVRLPRSVATGASTNSRPASRSAAAPAYAASSSAQRCRGPASRSKVTNRRGSGVGVRRPVVRAEADRQVLDAVDAGVPVTGVRSAEHVGVDDVAPAAHAPADRCARSRSKARSAGGLRIRSRRAAVGSSGP